MISNLQRHLPRPTCATRKRRPKGLARRSAVKAGWTPERRARQAARIRLWQPRRIRYVLRLCARNIAILRLHNRITRLERSVARKPQTPDAMSKIRGLRDVLARLTSALPCPPRPAPAAGCGKIAKSNERTIGDRNRPEQPSTCQGAILAPSPVMFFPQAGVNFRFAVHAPNPGREP